MTYSSVLNSTNRRHNTSISWVVPAASVWEPTPGRCGAQVGAPVRTLTPNCPRSLSATEGESPTGALRGAGDIRRENRRTFLLGAALGFTLVAGSLHLLAEAEPALEPGYVSTVTAEVAK